MRVTLPPPPEQYQRDTFQYAFTLLEQTIELTVTRNQAVQSILLLAPNNSVWKVTVDNSGNLVTTSVPLGQTGAPTV
jgi:hypothetical protein